MKGSLFSSNHQNSSSHQDNSQYPSNKLFHKNIHNQRTLKIDSVHMKKINFKNFKKKSILITNLKEDLAEPN